MTAARQKVGCGREQSEHTGRETAVLVEKGGQRVWRHDGERVAGEINYYSYYLLLAHASFTARQALF